MVSVLFQAAIAVFSMLAGLFWMASAYGQTVVPPWQPSQPVAQNERAQPIKRNGTVARRPALPLPRYFKRFTFSMEWDFHTSHSSRTNYLGSTTKYATPSHPPPSWGLAHCFSGKRHWLVSRLASASLSHFHQRHLRPGVLWYRLFFKSGLPKINSSRAAYLPFGMRCHGLE